jgi:flagellar protein FliO/FliZ
MGELLVRMVFSLAVVVGLLIVISRVAAKRFQGRAGSPIEVLHRQALSKSASVSVVQVAGRVLVLGTTEQQVNVLTELDPAVLADEDAWEAPVEDEVAEDLDPATYGEPLTVPSLEALLAEPDLVTLEELFGHRPPATAAAPSFDTAPAPAYAAHPAVTAIETAPAPEIAPPASEHDPVLPEDPSYAAFAAQLRAQLATGAFAEPGRRAATTTAPTTAPTSHATGNGRHAAPAPVMELPPVVTGGARAARVAPAAPAQPVAAPHPAPLVGSTAGGPVGTPVTGGPTGPSAADLAHLRAALLAAQVQASATPATPAAQAARAATRPADGPLSGSVLSPSTWRQAFRAVNRRAS